MDALNSLWSILKFVNMKMNQKSILLYKPFIILLLGTVCLISSCNSKAQSRQSESEDKKSTAEHSRSTEREALQNTPAIEVQTTAEWPCFHGPDYQNKSIETGLLHSWPDEGPELLYTISGLGEGYASVSVADGLLFTSGSIDDQTFVFAYDLEGKLVWKSPNGSAWDVEVYWAEGYDGSRSTPTYDNGLVYHLSEASRLTAYDVKTGDEIWSRNLMKDFNAEMPDYGFTESVRIEGEKLFVRPAGRKGFQVCLNKTTGETIWTKNEIPGTNAYSSAVLYDFGGYRQLISNSSNCYYGVDSETGKLLWKADFANIYEVNATDAVIFDDCVLMSNGLGGGSELIRLKSNGSKIATETVWVTDLMDNYHGGVIVHDEYLYGSGDKKRGWFCLDLFTGKQMWKSPARMGSLTYADGMLYLYDERGIMSLVKATPEEFVRTGEFRVPKGGAGPNWAHPVVCGGRLYLRHSDKLFVYRISNNI